MRSTPWPNETLRTVNEARVPPRCIPMTTPSKTWMRSLSPSRTRTCTLTVSPAFIAGRWANCDFSTSSIALIFDSFKLSQHFYFFFVQCRRVQQIRSAIERPAERFALPPSLDRRMIPRQQYVRHPQNSLAARHLCIPGPCALRSADQSGAANFRRPRELRKIEQSPAERILSHGLLVADDAGHEPGDCIQHHQGRQLAA